jgi:hypothetical protein
VKINVKHYAKKCPILREYLLSEALTLTKRNFVGVFVTGEGDDLT